MMNMMVSITERACVRLNRFNLSWIDKGGLRKQRVEEPRGDGVGKAERNVFTNREEKKKENKQRLYCPGKRVRLREKKCCARLEHGNFDSM